MSKVNEQERDTLQLEFNRKMNIIRGKWMISGGDIIPQPFRDQYLCSFILHNAEDIKELGVLSRKLEGE